MFDVLSSLQVMAARTNKPSPSSRSSHSARSGNSMSSVVLTLALASVQAIGQVAVVCVFGHILAKAGYLDVRLQRGLSKLSIQFFTPCLLFANTASSIDRSNVLQLWPLPVYFAIFAWMAWLLAEIGGWVLGFTPSQRKFAKATLMFSNTNSLPIGLVESLVFSAAFEWLKWTENDTRISVSSRGVAYIVFYAILGNLVRWSYGMFLLESDEDMPTASANLDERAPLLQNEAQEGSLTPIPTPKPRSATKGILRSRTVPTAFMYGNLMYFEDGSDNVSNGEEVQSIGTSEEAARVSPTSNHSVHVEEHDQHLMPPLQREVSASRRLLTKLNTFVKPLTSPPLLAALAGLFVGLTPLRGILVEDGAILQSTLFAAIEACGEAAVPLILVCLGAQLTTLADKKYERRPSSTSASAIRSKPAYGRVISFVVFSRLILLPLLVMVTVLFTMSYMGTLQHDPMFIVAVLLLGSCPTAVNLMTVCQANGCFEEPMGKVLMWEYVGSVVTLVGWCVGFLWLAQSMTR